MDHFIHKVKQLSPEHRREVEDFIDFLLDRYGDHAVPGHDDTVLIHPHEKKEKAGPQPILLPPEPSPVNSRSDTGREIIYVHADRAPQGKTKKKADDLLEWVD